MGERIRRETEPRNPRWSSSLLEMRTKEKLLMKQKRYPEATEVKADADTTQEKEKHAWQVKREQKIKTLEEQFLQKQRLEMSGLVKRLASGREEMKQARQVEFNRLLRRYLNVTKQLESQQKVIMQRLDKFPASPVDLAKVTHGSGSVIVELVPHAI